MIVSDVPTIALAGDSPKERGAVIVEFAVTLIPFLMLVLVSVQGALIGHTSLSLYYSVTRAAREASVSTALATADRTARIVALVTGYASGLGVGTADLTVRVCPLLDPNCAGQNPAGANQYFVITARKQQQIFWGLGSVIIGAKAMARNEPI